MRITELLDTVYDTIKLKVDTKGGAVATFRTEVDTYTVHFSQDLKSFIKMGTEVIEVPMVSISFSSATLAMGNASAEHAEYTTYVYPTVVQTALMFVKARNLLRKPVYGFMCSVAGDNNRGSKRKIYQALFTFSSRFGFHKWKKDLKAIQLDTYERLKKNGFKTERGEVIFDSEL